MLTTFGHDLVAWVRVVLVVVAFLFALGLFGLLGERLDAIARHARQQRLARRAARRAACRLWVAHAREAAERRLGAIPGRIWLAIVALATVLPVIGAFAYWVWPTPYRVLGTYHGLPLREHRFTGCVDVLTFEGWDRFSCRADVGQRADTHILYRYRDRSGQLVFSNGEPHAGQGGGSITTEELHAYLATHPGKLSLDELRAFVAARRRRHDG